MNIEDLYTAEAHDGGAEMQVKDESGKELDMYITLAGVDSKIFRKVKSEMHRKILNGDDAENVRAESLADITIDWRGFLSECEDLVFTKDLAKQLYINAPYVMEQADVFVATRGNFTKG